MMQDAISGFYRFIWNLFYAEYAIFPFIQQTSLCFSLEKGAHLHSWRNLLCCIKYQLINQLFCFFSMFDSICFYFDLMPLTYFIILHKMFCIVFVPLLFFGDQFWLKDVQFILQAQRCKVSKQNMVMWHHSTFGFHLWALRLPRCIIFLITVVQL